MVKQSGRFWAWALIIALMPIQPLQASLLAENEPTSPPPLPDDLPVPTPGITLPDRIITVPPGSEMPPADPLLTVPPEASTEVPLRLELRLSKRQLMLYKGDQVLKSYPVAIGRPGWETPTGGFRVLQKVEKPTWIHPLKENIVIPGGDPDNPLGNYWIGFWTDGTNWIGFHGTPTPESIGKAASHGCVRMYNRDIADLFTQIRVGTVVTVVQ
jgi:lipoprotein-anchoring transpeptidase ErfK/SrfK